ncbi:glutamyl-tRNA reductase [Hydromonas duriensis]|uniref:Glutamyl-tRNA reductase n=1 Tax=Hydromonas duriensis TaxID=1527608 RepID=A0A4R6Y4X7_9BURK|nr:glutamyl-tRNA reductase [Hydromonas duriensis]TDR29014.1 glutamyl-tRNA reductase [Hydromonas duriensis]
MPLFVAGLNHTTAPLALRERISFAPQELSHALPALQEDLLGKTASASSVQLSVLSTCNRMEVYGVLDDPMQLEAAVRWVATYHGVSYDELAPHIYQLSGHAAVQHAFAVASGMDSMVLGEPQILGQMKQAMRIAQQAGTADTILQQWFEKSFAVAKDVRTNTAIGEHSVSMAAAAVKLAKRVFDDFKQLNVLLVGAGEMMDVVIAHMAGQLPNRIAVANRSSDKAHALLAPYAHLNTDVLRLAALTEHLSEFDVVVTCTASTLPIIGLGMVENALKNRRHRPMVMVDLGVPRDIESAVAKLDDAYVYTVDDLSSIVQHNGAQREAALLDAQRIVDIHVKAFDVQQARRAWTPQVQQLRSRMDALRQAEMSRALNAVRGQANVSTSELEQLLTHMSQRMMNKILHEPTIGIQSEDDEVRHAWQVVTRDWLRGTDS